MEILCNPANVIFQAQTLIRGLVERGGYFRLFQYKTPLVSSIFKIPSSNHIGKTPNNQEVTSTTIIVMTSLPIGNQCLLPIPAVLLRVKSIIHGFAAF